MSPLVPALLAAAGVAVAVGLPAPRRVVGPGRLPGSSGTRDVAPGVPGSGNPSTGLPGPRDLAPRLPGSGDPSRDLALALRRAGPAAAVVAALPLLGPVGAGVLGVLVVVVSRAAAGRRVAQARQAERDGAQEALEVLVAELRAGRPPGDALQAAASVATGPCAATLAGASRASRFGVDPAAVLRDGAGRGAVPAVLSGLAACWQVCGATGSSLAAAVERLADALRAEHALRLAVEAELAGPRATAALLAGLPLAGIALAAGLGARPLHVLLHTAVGSGCLVAGVALDLLGLWWTGRLVAAAGPR